MMDWTRRGLLGWCLVAGSMASASPDAPTPSTCDAQRLPRVCIAPTPLASQLAQPVGVFALPDAPWLVVIEKGGTLRALPNTSSVDGAQLWGDLRSVVSAKHMEEGLLAAALHPRFPADPRVFVYHSVARPRRTILASYHVVGTAPGRIEPTSRQVVLEVPQPYGNHNGGFIDFLADGTLLLGVGDGGSGGDPQGNGQNTGSLLGSILRLDINSASPYAIPEDNPFADGQTGRPEVWAWGLRNPWRGAVDPKTDTLWVGDVGQNLYEEVSRIVPGGNHGWALREGAHCYDAKTCRSTGLVPPVWEYGHDQGISITGGHVYRGSAMPGLQGWFVAGDFGSGKVWAVCGEPGAGQSRELISTGLNIASFGLDGAKETLVVDFAGDLRQLVPCDGAPSP